MAHNKHWPGFQYRFESVADCALLTEPLGLWFVDEEPVEDAETLVCRKLWNAVIFQAMRDRYDKRVSKARRAEAARFFKSYHLEFICELLGYDVEKVRQCGSNGKWVRKHLL